MLWALAIYWAYRVRHVDLFILAGAVSSAVVVISLGLGRSLIGMGGAAGFLFVGLVLIVAAGAGAYWLRQVAAEERT